MDRILIILKKENGPRASSVKGAHLMPPGERFITWDLPVEILVGVA